MKLLLVGDFFGFPGNLGMSYRAAFESLGCEVALFDVRSALDKYTRFGGVGRRLRHYFPVDAWLLKMNRELAALCSRERPAAVVVVGATEIKAGALAQIKASAGSRLAFVWMDPLQNLTERAIQCLPVYDVVASYSLAAVEPFRLLGARRAEWVAFAGDPQLYGGADAGAAGRFECDVSFVGNWRPEREAALDQIASTAQVKLKVWGGGSWRRSRSRAVKEAWQGEAVYAAEFAAAVRASKISLNVMDDTNYPAANMRFFEIPCIGGLQLCSPCPELESEFRHGETIFYFKGVEELPRLVRSLLVDEALRRRVAAAAHRKVAAAHTYAHRAAQILEALAAPERRQAMAGEGRAD